MVKANYQKCHRNSGNSCPDDDDTAKVLIALQNFGARFFSGIFFFAH